MNTIIQRAHVIVSKDTALVVFPTIISLTLLLAPAPMKSILWLSAIAVFSTHCYSSYSF